MVRQIWFGVDIGVVKLEQTSLNRPELSLRKWIDWCNEFWVYATSRREIVGEEKLHKFSDLQTSELLGETEQMRESQDQRVLEKCLGGQKLKTHKYVSI